MNIPNTLSWIRIVIVPVFIGVFYIERPWTNELVTGLFAAAAITDWLDGYLARRLNQTSAFGAFLDPVADKLVVAAALVLLVQADPRAQVTVPAIIIIGREIAISALREWMAMLGQRGSVAVVYMGKIKTVVQMLAISLLLYRDDVGPLPTYDIGLFCLYGAAVLTLWSMAIYLKAAWPLMAMEVPDGHTDQRQQTGTPKR
ncbi:MAG: CDP-diacylglycerol--glycerol-3-phosphate 3-phosphatidyltransferase [Gammaproteobacteria bacterium]|nr:CDP-diacylglycerol--glycerol-3-phosphate 3-phosphatidyltransferase [Gammaproteobacteria bacterium]